MEDKLHPKFKPARLCRKCGAAGKPFKKHSGNAKNGICLDCHADYVADYTKRKWVAVIQENNELKSEIETLRANRKKLVAALRFYADLDNWIQEDDGVYDGKTAIDWVDSESLNFVEDDDEDLRTDTFGGKLARTTLKELGEME